MADQRCFFKPETVGEVMKEVWKDSKTAANKDSLTLAAEYLKLLTIEALERSAAEARKNSRGASSTANVHLDAAHLEKIIPQLLLDF